MRGLGQLDANDETVKDIADLFGGEDYDSDPDLEDFVAMRLGESMYIPKKKVR